MDRVAKGRSQAVPSRASVSTTRLFEPVDIASIVFLRIAFGGILIWEVARYVAYDWIDAQWIRPAFHFTYYGLDWVRPWPGDGMHHHFHALGVLALCILLGLAYRVAAPLFCLGFSYVFLLDQTTYLNHFYLICLISFLLVFVPAHRAFSIDAWLRPGIRSQTTPAWTLWLMRAQLAIPYFYGGLTKLNGDWLRGEPMRGWLAHETDFPVIGSLFTEEWVVYLASYGGLLFDLLIVPGLLWRRTCLLAFALATAFHVTNSRLFDIGIFPWFMIAATTLFFRPDWPRHALSWFGLRRAVRPARHPVAPARAMFRGSKAIVAVLLCVYLLFQLLFPLRHLLYPGRASWSEEGLRFAWFMKAYWKESHARFLATDPERERTWEIDPFDYLTPHQAQIMRRQPDMVLQFAHHVARDLRRAGHEQIQVRVKIAASLNGRKPQWMIDPTVDLAAQPRSLLPASWIRPLTVPLTPSLEDRDFETLLGPSAVELDRTASAFRTKGQFEEAIPLLRDAVNLGTASARIRARLGDSLVRTRRLEEAIPHLRGALELDPALIPAHVDLGMALGQLGRFDEAASQLGLALSLDPENARAHYNMGLALLKTARTAEALRHLREADRVNRDPDWLAPLTVMTSILATHTDPLVRDVDEAVRLGERAARQSDNRDPAILDALAIAYAAAGLLDRAVATAESALVLANATNTRLAAGIRRRLELYREGKSIGPAADP